MSAPDMGSSAASRAHVRQVDKALCHTNRSELEKSPDPRLGSGCSGRKLPSLHSHSPEGAKHVAGDEVAVRIGGKLTYLWRAVDAEGEVLEVLVQAKRARRRLASSCARC